MRISCRCNRRFHRFLRSPAHPAGQHVFTARNFDQNAVHTAGLCQVHVRKYTPDKAVNLCLQPCRADFLQCFRIFLGGCRAAGFDSVHSGFIQFFGNRKFVFLGKDNTGFLFAVSQCGIQNLNLFRKMEFFGDFFRKISGAYPPFSLFFISHF